MGVYPVMQAQWLAVMGSNPSYFKGTDRPVDSVSWENCVVFCERLGQRFRLPTEAEWEYACRAGTSTAYYTGDGLDALKRAGWCSYDGTLGSGMETRPVGQFEPNAWGLYDMTGNVWEWCLDKRGDYRVLRGGSWCGTPRNGRSADKVLDRADYRYSHIGFRILLCPDDQGP
jgi:formylglycine-generating enzyme required for sulfatase activity